MKNKDISFKEIGPSLVKLLSKGRGYVGFFLFLLFAMAYGFVVLQINSLSNTEVDQNEVNAAVKASPTPKVDPKVVDQLQALRDSSINVKTLFEKHRTNPFQE